MGLWCDPGNNGLSAFSNVECLVCKRRNTFVVRFIFLDNDHIFIWNVCFSFVSVK